jgi:hypothetical protein
MRRAPADLKLVLQVVSAILFGQLCVSLAYELILRPQSAFYIQHQRFMKPDVAPQIVFLGDSRAMYALHHGTMDRNFFNYAHFGEPPFNQILRARHVLRDKPLVRAFVIQLDPYVISGQRSIRPFGSGRGFYEAMLFAPRRDIEDLISPDTTEYLRNVAAFLYPMSLSWEREDFWGALRQELTRAGIDRARLPGRYLNGCSDLVLREEGDWSMVATAERNKKAVEQVRGRYVGMRFDPALAKMITDFVADARNRGLEMFALLLPETVDFQRAAAPLIDPRARDFASSLGIPVLNYRNAFDDAPQFFTDPDHLNTAGSAELSGRIADDLRLRLGLAVAEKWACESAPLTTVGRLAPFGWVRTAMGF